MARPGQFRRIFAELRRARPNASGRELLQLTDYIIRAHREPELIEFNDGYGRRSFFAQDIVSAFEDGGWRVLDFERRQGMSFDDEISDNRDRVEVRLRPLIGRTKWPRTGMD
jgi:hypothetical protein